MATTLEIVLTIVNLHQSHSNKRGTEPEFLKLLRSPGFDSQLGGTVRQPYLMSDPTGYIGWRNRFLRIDSWTL
jgi:hypothetical protein